MDVVCHIIIAEFIRTCRCFMLYHNILLPLYRTLFTITSASWFINSIFLITYTKWKTKILGTEHTLFTLNAFQPCTQHIAYIYIYIFFQYCMLRSNAHLSCLLDCKSLNNSTWFKFSSQNLQTCWFLIGKNLWKLLLRKLHRGML